MKRAINRLGKEAGVKESVVEGAMKRMATVVDKQNMLDEDYIPMSPTFDYLAFIAACDLVFKGTQQRSCYTELLLHQRLLEQKNLKYSKR